MKLKTIVLGGLAIFIAACGDKAMYHTECHRSCVEDSFGKAGAEEIVMRCSAKCDHLPVSPKEQWKKYDNCEAYNAESRDFLQNNAAALRNCNDILEPLLEECRKKYGALSNSKSSTGYVPGVIADDYLRMQKLEQCEASVHRSESADCSKLAVEKIVKEHFQNQECLKPNVPRPN